MSIYKGGSKEMNLAEKIMFERKKTGLSQEQLADKLGITRQAISKWEAGSAVPELSKLLALSEVFGVSIDYLVKDSMKEDISRYREEAYEASGESARRLEEKVDNLERYIRGYQFTSKTKIGGIPLVSIRFSRNLGKDGVAKGIIAMGNVAVGVLSFGALSVGVVSFGALTAGLIAIGALAAGGFAWGALAVGIVAFGSCAIGIYSIGAAAYGTEIAVGAAAGGKTVIGDSVSGVNCLKWYEGISPEEIEAFLLKYHPKLWGPLRSVLTICARHIH